MASSWTRDQTPVPCIGRRILNHWTTREVPGGHFSSKCKCPGSGDCWQVWEIASREMIRVVGSEIRKVMGAGLYWVSKAFAIPLEFTLDGRESQEGYKHGEDVNWCLLKHHYLLGRDCGGQGWRWEIGRRQVGGYCYIPDERRWCQGRGEKRSKSGYILKICWCVSCVCGTKSGGKDFAHILAWMAGQMELSLIDVGHPENTLDSWKQISSSMLW